MVEIKGFFFETVSNPKNKCRCTDLGALESNHNIENKFLIPFPPPRKIRIEKKLTIKISLFHSPNPSKLLHLLQWQM
jgi:hypothetical protein